jgi:hypothetical protein
MKLNLNLLFSNKAAAQQGAAAEPPFVTSVAPPNATALKDWFDYPRKKSNAIIQCA